MKLRKRNWTGGREKGKDFLKKNPHPSHTTLHLRATPSKKMATSPKRLPPRFSKNEKGGNDWIGTTLGRACSRGCRERKVRSKIGWLAGSRDSHHVSRFAAFFILARAEISVDGSCFGVYLVSFFALWKELFFFFPPLPSKERERERRKKKKKKLPQ